jgi:hypothetical protein
LENILKLNIFTIRSKFSIKRSTYNAAPYLGAVNWDKNVTGVGATKTMYPPVRGVDYES